MIRRCHGLDPSQCEGRGQVLDQGFGPLSGREYLGHSIAPGVVEPTHAKKIAVSLITAAVGEPKDR